MTQNEDKATIAWRAGKRLAGATYGLFYRLRFPGRIHGRSFIIRRPSLIRIEPSGRVFVGPRVHFEPQLRMIAKDRLSIGEDVYVGKNATLVAFETLVIGARTLIGENVSIHTENHGPAGQRGSFECSPIQIGEDVWIGAGVVITSGVTIGDRVTIGANAVVTKSFPEDVFIAGVPAKIIKTG